MKYFILTLILTFSFSLGALADPRCCTPDEGGGAESLSKLRRETPGALSNAALCECLESGTVGSEPRLNDNTIATAGDAAEKDGSTKAAE